MIHRTDEKNSAASRRVRHLRVTFQAEVGVAFHEHFRVDRTVRRMTNRAAFAKRVVFEHKWPRLLAMALGAILVQPGHR